tara:strand:+ start:507 stop:626 length:120 start_codon:yes stop_codon:yes gene_type:complete
MVKEFFTNYINKNDYCMYVFNKKGPVLNEAFLMNFMFTA